MSVIGLLIALLLTSRSHARQVRDEFRRIRTREAGELLIAPDRPAASVIQRLSHKHDHLSKFHTLLSRSAGELAPLGAGGGPGS
jgi:hypothetical protein